MTYGPRPFWWLGVEEEEEQGVGVASHGKSPYPLWTACTVFTYVIIFTKIAFAVIENIVYSVFRHRKTVILFRKTRATDGNIE